MDEERYWELRNRILALEETVRIHPPDRSKCPTCSPGAGHNAPDLDTELETDRCGVAMMFDHGRRRADCRLPFGHDGLHSA